MFAPYMKDNSYPYSQKYSSDRRHTLHIGYTIGNKSRRALSQLQKNTI
jgi:hypothetical protein